MKLTAIVTALSIFLAGCATVKPTCQEVVDNYINNRVELARYTAKIVFPGFTIDSFDYREALQNLYANCDCNTTEFTDYPVHITLDLNQRVATLWTNTSTGEPPKDELPDAPPFNGI